MIFIAIFWRKLWIYRKKETV